MAAGHTTWTVLDHGPLVTVAEGVWCVDGAVPDIPLSRRMTIARGADGRLVVHNAICTRDDVRAQIEALGDVAVLLVPNGWHRLDARPFADRYPAARVLCPRGARARVEQVVAVHGSYDADDAPAEARPTIDGHRVRLAHLAGTKEREGVMIVDGSDGATLVVNDALFNLPHGRGLFWLIYGRLMRNSGGLKVTTVGRLTLVADKRAFFAHLGELAGTPRLERLIMSHGDRVEHGAAAALAALAAKR